MSLQIVIPMAGEGSRFEKEGYQTPKPFLPLDNFKMIESVVFNLGFKDCKFYLITKEKYKPQILECKFNYPIKIVTLDYKTEGAACTVNLLKNTLDLNLPLVIANSDQIVDFNKEKFYNTLKFQNTIITFNSQESFCSFVKTNEKGLVIEVKEKQVISQEACTGIYGFQKSKYYFEAFEEMYKNKNTYNSEYYIAPVYNYLNNTYTFKSNQMWCLGIPEQYENNKKEAIKYLNDSNSSI